jgi:outer membrane protein assembly factor BamB
MRPVNVSFAMHSIGHFGAVLLFSSLASALWAGDWPQILGPDRNGVAQGEKLAEHWPADGPQLLWKAKLGSGYAGPAVVGDRVYVFHRLGATEQVLALDAADGKEVWKADFKATYRPGVDPDDGPRCVPLVVGGCVYVLGAAGDLRCIDAVSGKSLWERHLYADHGGDEGYFGAGSTPILLGGRLLVNVGGRGAGIVAIDPKSGKTLWQASDEGASYSSPAAVLLEGKDQALFITRMNCVLADPAAGKVSVLFPFGRRGPTVNAATPLVVGGKLFITSSYGVGAAYASLDASGAKELWASDDTLSSQYATPVIQDGIAYGTHGREDQGMAELRAIDLAKREVRWSQPGFGVAHLMLADGKLLVLKVDGKLELVRAMPEKYAPLATCDLGVQTTRALPALASGRLFVRTGSGGGDLRAYHVAP